MAYFNSAFLDFFKALAANNHKEWFHAQRPTYLAEVKKPFEDFVAAFLELAAAQEPRLYMPVRDCIFRINRDVRFSKDKAPYKLHRSAVIVAGGKKNKAFPGFYFECTPEEVGIYGGAYLCDTASVAAIRTLIRDKPLTFKKRLDDAAFVSHFGTLRGATHKRIPKAFKAAAEQQPLLFNKQFYYKASLPAETILREDFLEVLWAYYEAGTPMRHFLERAYETAT